MAPLPYTRALKFFLKYRTISEKRPYFNCYNYQGVLPILLKFLMDTLSCINPKHGLAFIQTILAERFYPFYFIFVSLILLI